VPVVGDSSRLILYAAVGRLELVHRLFGEVVVPPAVWSEVTSGGGRPGAQEVASASWIRKQAPLRSPTDHGLPGDLDAGEAEAIALALQAADPVVVLIDDRVGRRAATQRGLTVIGSAGIVVLAKRRGLLAAVRPVLDQLRAAGLYLGEPVYGAALQEAGESQVGRRPEHRRTGPSTTRRRAARRIASPRAARRGSGGRQGEWKRTAFPSGTGGFFWKTRTGVSASGVRLPLPVHP
jgi:predicted nucleic acid-binding protein